MNNSAHDLLKESFDNNFIGKEDCKDKEKFLNVFNEVASKMPDLQIVDGFVDIGFKKGLIDFNLLLNDGWFLSVAKSASSEDEEFMFAIAKNGYTLLIGEMLLDEVIDRLNDYMKKEFN